MAENASRAELLKKLRDDPGCGELPVDPKSVVGTWIAWNKSKSPAKLAAFRKAVDVELGGKPSKPAVKPATKPATTPKSKKTSTKKSRR